MNVFPPVLKDIDHRDPCLARRTEHARVVLPAPDRACSAERSIERTGCPDAKPRHAERQRRLVCRLNDRVDVIDLDGKLNDSKLVAGRSAYRRRQRGERAGRAE